MCFINKKKQGKKKWAWVLSVGIHLMVALSLYFFSMNEKTAPMPLIKDIELNFESNTLHNQPRLAQQLNSKSSGEPAATPIPTIEKNNQPANYLVEDSTTTSQKPIPMLKNTTNPSFEKKKHKVQAQQKQEQSTDNTPTTMPNPNNVSPIHDALSQSQNTTAHTIDERALYGTKKQANALLELPGWQWDFIPKPNDNTDEQGKIIFEIQIDEFGEVVGVNTLEKTVSPWVAEMYKDALEKLTFSKTNEKILYKPISTGKITFLIQSR